MPPSTPETPTPQASSCARSPLEATPRQVREWLQSGEAILVDVREPDEHARERIAGARLTPLSRFDPGQLAALAAGGQRIVIHCRSGRRSQDACRLATPLIERGAAIVNMTGGIEAWKKESLPVEGGSGSSMISVMRQVQLVIGVCVLSGSALAWLVDPRFMVIPAFFGAGLIFAGASGTCALATVVGWMPWNRITPRPASCTSDRCGP